MMEKMDPMKKALAMRRGQGIDIKIIVGESDEEQEKKTDLAPKPAMPESEVAEDGQAPLEAMDPKAMPQGVENAEMDAEMLDKMSEFDKQDLSSRKPRSLGEYAKKAAMGRSEK
jgi:hypothetical protein